MTEQFIVEVKINDRMKVSIKLEEEMTALEFLGIVHQAKALFNISNKELVFESQDIKKQEKDKETVTKLTGPIKTIKRTHIIWTPFMHQFLRENYGKMPVSELAKMSQLKGVKIANLYNKASKMGLTNKVN